MGKPIVKRLGRRTRLLFGVGAGATAMYFLDPDRGTARRARARDQLLARRRRLQRASERANRYASGVAKGMAHDRPAQRPVDDQALVDRVKSVLGPRLPHDRVSVDVVDGMIELRGELEDQNEINDLVAEVAGVADVTTVISLLHLPGQPAPNKAAALAASHRAETSGAS